MRKILLTGLLSALLCVFPDYAFAQTRTTVKFPRGTHGTTVKGTVRGYAYRDYMVGAAAGQIMELNLTAANSPSVFTVFLPNEDNLDGAAEMNDFSGKLPSAGNYIIRVGMMRSAARRKGSVSNFTLKISIK